MAGVAQAYQHLLTIDCLLFSGVLADLDPSRFGPLVQIRGFGPPPPPTELSENIILRVVQMDQSESRIFTFHSDDVTRAARYW